MNEPSPDETADRTSLQNLPLVDKLNADFRNIVVLGWKIGNIALDSDHLEICTCC